MPDKHILCKTSRKWGERRQRCQLYCWSICGQILQGGGVLRCILFTTALFPLSRIILKLSKQVLGNSARWSNDHERAKSAPTRLQHKAMYKLPWKLVWAFLYRLPRRFVLQTVGCQCFAFQVCNSCRTCHPSKSNGGDACPTKSGTNAAETMAWICNCLRK